MSWARRWIFIAMGRLRIFGITVVSASSLAAGLVVAGVAASALASAPPPPTLPSTQPPPTSSPVPVSSTPSLRPTPALVNRPPGRVIGLHVSRTIPVLLRWSLPSGGDLATVIVRRGAAGDCPAGRKDGTLIGVTGVRDHQLDRTAVRGTAYCYAVFAVDTADQTSPRARAYVEVPFLAPDRVTGVQVTPGVDAIVVAWRPSTNATAYRVFRTAGSTCSGTGTQLAAASSASFVDTAASPGASYCYAVVAVGAGGKTSKPSASAGPLKLAAAPAPRRTPAPPTKRSSSLLGSRLAQLAAAVASGVVLFGLLALLAVRFGLPQMRHGVSGHTRPRLGMRAALQQYDAGALVIPLAILVIGLGLLAVAAMRL